MYKQLKTKKFRIAIQTFNKKIKNSLPPITDVYNSGIRNWISDDSYNYSIVIYCFRIIFSIDRNNLVCCNN